MGGTETTLILHPDGRGDITFDQSASDDNGLLSGYVVPAGSLNFSEEKRIEVVYGADDSPFPEPVDTNEVLTDVTFDVIVSGTSLADMLQNVHALEMAVHNDDGGTLEFKPDGLGAGVRSTFYHYIKSPIPARRQARGNRTDRGANSARRHRLVLEVTLRTWPIATSDPDTLVSVLGATTAYNTGDGSQDFVTVDGDNVPGSQPALARFQITPGAGGAAQVSRLILARRTKGLDNFEATYLSSASTYINESGVWGTETDAGRCGGNYVRCTPEQSGIEYGRRWTISNWSDHRGRAAIALVVRNNSTHKNDWNIYYGWQVGSRTVYGKTKHVSQVGQWEVLLLGEFDLPDTEMSAMEGLDLYLDVYIKRRNGAETLDIDAAKLLYTDECALQVEATQGDGAGNTDTILIENVSGEEISHVLDSSDKLAYLLASYGNFPTLKPGQDNQFDVIWERYLPEGYADNFEDYDALWKQIASFGGAEVWTGSTLVHTSDEPASVCEDGDDSQQMTLTAGAGSMTGTLPSLVSIAEFESGDYVCLGCAIMYNSAPSAISVTLRLVSDSGDYFSRTFSPSVARGWQILNARLSDFSETGNPTWGSITQIEIEASFTGGSEHELHFDDLRACKADPDNAAVFNETGIKWNGVGMQRGHIGAQDGETYFYVVDYQSTSGWRSLWPDESFGFTDFVLWAKVWVDGGAPNTCGLWFRATDLTAGSEDGYLFKFSPLGVSRVDSYTAGSSGGALADFARDVDKKQWFWLGVIGLGTSIRCFVGPTETDLFQPEYMEVEITDSDHSGSLFGLFAEYEGTRYSEFHLEPIKDRHVPADSVSVQVNALLRTIYPFYE